MPMELEPARPVLVELERLAQRPVPPGREQLALRSAAQLA